MHKNNAAKGQAAAKSRRIAKVGLIHS